MGTPLRSCSVMPLLTTSDDVQAQRCMKVTPALMACDPVTYDAANRVLKLWLALWP